jgi:hypothetical protein
MPVELRVVEEELDALLVALVGQHLEDVLLVGRAVHDVVVGDLESNIAKPSWCLLVIVMYFMPAALARDTHSAGSNSVGLNRPGSFS